MNAKILLHDLVVPTFFYRSLRGVILSISLSIAFGAFNTTEAQTISFRISERTLLLGDTAVLKWRVEGIRKRDSLHLTGYEGTPPVSGELRVSPEHDVTYTLTHIRRNNTTQRKIKVKVYHPEVILFSGPETALYQVPVQLQWRTRHATRVSLTDVEGFLPLDGSRMVIPNGPMTYSLEVCNRNNRCVTARHKIGMQGDYLRGTSAILKGGSGELLWRVHGATRVSLEGHDSLLPAEGRMAGWFKELDDATHGFIRRKHTSDRLAILRFDDKIGLEAPLNRDGQLVMSKVKFNKGRDYGGSTALYAAAGAGMELLRDTARDKVLMVMTDGFENSSVYYWGKYFTKANEVLLHARKEHVTINTINFRGQANTPLLEALADLTGGRSYLLRNEKEIEKVFNELQHLYHNYYELRYRPADPPGDRIINLLYQSEKDQQMITTAKAWISDDIDLDAIEKSGLGLDSALMQIGNQSVLLRQTVALFDFDKWELDSSSAQKLDRVIAYLEHFSDYKVIIQGHSDLVGNTSYCRYISRARAKAVYDYLLKGGVPAKRMKYEGKGKSEPVWRVEEAGWQARENRRVELLFVQ